MISVLEKSLRVSATITVSELLDGREVGGSGVNRFDLVDELAVCFRGFFDFDPIGVVLEGVPAFFGRFAAVVGQDVDQRVL